MGFRGLGFRAFFTCKPAAKRGSGLLGLEAEGRKTNCLVLRFQNQEMVVHVCGFSVLGVRRASKRGGVLGHRPQVLLEASFIRPSLKPSRNPRDIQTATTVSSHFSPIITFLSLTF